MRAGAGLTSTKLTLFFRSSTTGRTTDSKCLFAGEFSLHSKKITPQPFTGMVNVEQFRQLLHQRLAAQPQSLAFTVLLREQAVLNLGEFHRCGAGFVVVRHVVDATAHRIASHE